MASNSKSKKPEYPEEGEIVIGTVKNITQHGAFITMEEYPKHDGMLHISEISSKWIKNIRNHVEKGQKVVVKVLKVDKKKKHIDLSLKAVKDSQKKRKLEQYKKENSAAKLIEYAGKKIEDKEKVPKIINMLEDEFGGLYEPLEKASFEGKQIFSKSKLPEKWKKILTEVAKEQIEKPTVEIKADFKISTMADDGIELVKKAVEKGVKEAEGDEVKVEFKYIAAPKYRVVITAPNYKTAEKSLDTLNKTLTKALSSNEGEVKLNR